MTHDDSMIAHHGVIFLIVLRLILLIFSDRYHFDS